MKSRILNSKNTCKNISAFIIVIFTFSTFFSCNQAKLPEKTNITEEKTIVENTIKNCIGWAKNKDTALLYSIIADTSIYLEVQPTENVVKGITEFKKAEKFWLNPNFKAIRYDVKDMKIDFSKNGEVAWFYCILNDINEWKGQPASWENTRWTGVLEKQSGKWRMMQMHFSFASKE